MSIVKDKHNKIILLVESSGTHECPEWSNEEDNARIVVDSKRKGHVE